MARSYRVTVGDEEAVKLVDGRSGFGQPNLVVLRLPGGANVQLGGPDVVASGGGTNGFQLTAGGTNDVVYWRATDDLWGRTASSTGTVHVLRQG